MQLTPRRIGQLAQIAFTLEPLLEKSGCTTRYVDLEDKPLVDFIVAGINVGAIVENFAKQAMNNEVRMFSHYKQAILASNNYKTKKLINTGLLHFLFVTICVRLKSNSLEEAINNYVPVMQATTNQDARDFVAGMEISWSTSSKKSAWLQARHKVLPKISSYYELQGMIYKNSPDNTTSSYQVTKQAYEGFPIIREFITGIDENVGLLRSIETTYNKIRADNPATKVGVLADLSASALFLYLSFQDPEIYIIR